MKLTSVVLNIILLYIILPLYIVYISWNTDNTSTVFLFNTFFIIVVNIELQFYYLSPIN